MGGRCCKFELSASASAETIHASADVVWDILTDLESLPKVLSMVKEVKRINHNNHFYYNSFHKKKKKDNDDDGENWREGTSWDEIRIFKGREFISRKSITNLTVYKKDGEGGKRKHHHKNSSNDNIIRSVGMNVCHQPISRYHPKNSTITTSFIVLPIDDKSCTLVASMGFVSDGFFQFMNPERLFLQRTCKRYMTEYLQEEIDDYARAAMALEASTKRRTCFTTTGSSNGQTVYQEQQRRQQRCR